MIMLYLYAKKKRSNCTAVISARQWIFSSTFNVVFYLNREDNSLQSPDACRIHGHLYVNKVAGNFHITVGKYVLSIPENKKSLDFYILYSACMYMCVLLCFS